LRSSVSWVSLLRPFSLQVNKFLDLVFQFTGKFCLARILWILQYRPLDLFGAAQEEPLKFSGPSPLALGPDAPIGHSWPRFKPPGIPEGIQEPRAFRAYQLVSNNQGSLMFVL